MKNHNQIKSHGALISFIAVLALLFGFMPRVHAAVDTWDGYYGSTWDTTNSFWNWDGQSTAHTYTAGNGALFCDYAENNFSISITGTVSPASITVTSTTGRAWALGGGVIAGSGTLGLLGNATLTLTGLNTYNGGTTLNSGTLNINSGASVSSAIGTGSLIIAGSGVVIDNTSGGGVLLATNNTQAWNSDFAFGGSNALNLGTGAVTLGGSRIVTVNGTAPLTVGGIIGGSGYSLTKAGTGTLVLNGANSFTGGLTLNAGTLVVGVAAAPGTGTLTLGGGTLAMHNSANTLTLSNNNVQSWTGDFAFGDFGNLNLGTGTVTLTANRQVTVNPNTILTVGGAIGGSGYSLTKAGGGVLVLNVANSYSGGTVLNGGVLSLNNAGALGSGTLTINGGAIDNMANNVAVTLSGNKPMVWNGDFTFLGTSVGSGVSGALNMGTGAVTINGNRTLSNYAGGSNSDLLTIGGAINSGAAGTSLTINPFGSITLSGALGANIGDVNINAGTGVVTANAANSFTGNLTVGTGATAALGGANAMSGITLNGGWIKAGANGSFGTGSLTINGGVVDASAGSLTLTVGSQTWNNNWTFNGANALNMGTGAITLGNNVVVGEYSSALTIAGGIGDGGHNYGLALESCQTGSGVIGITLSGNNSYTGPTSIYPGAVVALTGSNATSGITVYGGANLTLGTASTAPNNYVLGTGTLTLMAGTTLSIPKDAVLTLATNNPQTWAGDFIFNGTPNNNQSLGTGTVTLTGNRNVYSTSLWGSIFSIGGISDGGNNYGLTIWGNRVHLTRASTFTGGLTINKAATNNGNLYLDFNAAGAPNTDILTHNSALTLNGITLTVNGATSGITTQTLGGFTLSGYNAVTLNQNGGTSTTLNLPNTWNRPSGGIVYFTNAASTATIVSSAPVSSAASLSSSSSILPYAYAFSSFPSFATVVNNKIVPVPFTSSISLVASTGTDTASNYYYFTTFSALTKNTSINSLQVLAGNTLDLGGNTLTLASGGLLFASGANTIQNGTVTAGPAKELVISNLASSQTISANIDSNAALTLASSGNPINVTGNVTNTPIINFNNSYGTMTVSGTITGVSTMNFALSDYGLTIGTLGTAGTPLGNQLTINNQNFSAIAGGGPALSGSITGNGSTVLTINNNIAYENENGATAVTLSGGITGVSTINFTNPLMSILFYNAAPTGNANTLQITGANAVTGLSALSLSNIAKSSNVISAPLTLGNKFAVTETNQDLLTISGAITGNGSTAISFVAPALFSAVSTPNIISNNIGDGTAGHAVASISADGVSGLSITGALNSSATVNLTLQNTAMQQIKATGVITAQNLTVKGGNGVHIFWEGLGGLLTTQGMVDLSPTSANTFGSGNTGTTTVTDAALYVDNASNTVAKIGTGALTLSSASLIVRNDKSTTNSVASTLIGAGQSSINLWVGAGSLTLGAITNANFGTVNIAPDGSTGTFITTGVTNSLIGGWATYGFDFAAIGSGNVVTAPGSASVPAYTTLVAAATSLGSTINAQFAFWQNLTMTAPIVANALKINNTGDTTIPADLNINLQGNNITLTSGGLLYANTATGGGTIMTGSGTIFGDSGATGNSPLYVTIDPITTGGVVSASPLTITDSMVGGGAGTLVKTGYGELILTASAGYSGGTVINGGYLRADGNALSTGPLTFNSAGALSTSGSFTRAIGTSTGQVSFGPGGGGFSAEGGNLTVNLGGGAASVNASTLGGNLVVGSQIYSTGILNFMNPIVMDQPFTITTSNSPDSNNPGTMNNLGTAYVKLTGGITGTGGLTIFAAGQHNSNTSNALGFSEGLVAVPGGLNFTGPISLYGSSLYVPSIAALANNSLGISGGGVLASNGTANITYGAANGQIAFFGNYNNTNGTVGGGFAAVGGPLAIVANQNIAWNIRNDAMNSYGPTTQFTLGSAFSTNAVDYQSPFQMAAGMTLTTMGPVPNIFSGQIIGPNNGSTCPLAVNGNGILVISNPNDSYAGNLDIASGAMLRAGSPAALGNPNSGSFLTIEGVLDLNGYSFSGRTWSNLGGGATNNAGPIAAIPALINTNTSVTGTFGSASGTYYVQDGNSANGIIGGPGNIVMAGKFVGSLNYCPSPYLFKGTGTVTIAGDTAAVVYGGPANIKYSETVSGLTLVLDYGTDTLTKFLTGYSPNSTTAQQLFSLNSGNLQLKGNASNAVTDSLPVIGGSYLAGPGATNANAGLVGLNLPTGFNTIKLTTSGANLTLNAGGIIQATSGAIDFSTNTVAGGSASINFGAAGLAVALTNGGGAGYAASQTSLPIVISAPNTAGGVQAIGHAATNSSGVVTGVYIDNWGSGYTSSPTISIPGGGTLATASLYFNNPVTNIIGGYATYSGTTWAYRDSNGNIAPAANLIAQDNPGLWTANQNIATSAGLTTAPVGASLTIGSLLLNAADASHNTLNITSGQTLSLGYNTTNITQLGGILVTSAVGANDITITGGSLQSAVGGSALFVHQNNTSGKLVIASAIPSDGSQYLVKDGAGTLVLSNAANAFSGLLITGGVLEVPSLANAGSASPGGSGGTSVGSGAGSLVVQGGGTYRVNASSPQATNALLNVGIGGGTLDASGAGTVTFNGRTTRFLTDNYTTAVTGDGYSNFTLAGNGNGVMNGSILLLTPPQSGGNNTGGLTSGAVVEGFTQVTKTGSGTWTLNAYNYWQGGTIINQGTLVLNLNPATAYQAGPAYYGVNVVSNSSFAAAISPDAPVEIDTNGTMQLNYAEVTGAVRLYGGNVTGAGTLWGRSYDFQAGTVSVPMVGDFSAVTKTGAGTATIIGTNNTYGGLVNTPTTISAGNLQLGDGTTGHNGAVTGTILNNATLTVNNYEDQSFSNAVTGVGAFVKAGSGKLTVAGTQTYTGATNVTGGKLVVSGSLSGTSGVTVQPGATLLINGLIANTANPVISGTLGGTGVVAGNVTVTGGVIAPGTVGSPLTIGGTVNLDSSSKFAFTLGTSGTTTDSVTATGQITLATGASLVLQDLNGAASSYVGGEVIKLFNSPNFGATTFGSNLLLPTLTGGVVWDSSQLYTQGVLVVAVPEPQTWVMLFSGIGMLTLLRRRRS